MFYSPPIIQQIKFQTKHGNLDATNAYPQLDTSTRTGSVTHNRSNRVHHLLANCVQRSTPGKPGAFAWIAGTGSVTRGFVMFRLKFIFLIQLFANY